MLLVALCANSKESELCARMPSPSTPFSHPFTYCLSIIFAVKGYPCCPSVQVRIRIWEKGPDGEVHQQPLADCISEGKSGAVEVGGGPWWSSWKGNAQMAEPVKQLLNLPVDMEALADFVPPQLRPPGL